MVVLIEQLFEKSFSLYRAVERERERERERENREREKGLAILRPFR